MEIYMRVMPFVLSFVIGLCIGSFLNVIIYRLPRRSFLSSSRSRCPACSHTLAPWELVPVLSWLFLRGKCRRCGVSISVRYPITELAAGLIAIACWMRFGVDPMLIISFGVSAILLAIALIDHDTMTIPDSLIISLVPFAIASVWAADITVTARLIGFFAVSIPLLAISLIKKDAFGGGDIKLTALCGFLLGWQNMFLAFFISLLLGGGLAVILLGSGRSKAGTHMAFGPFLCIGIAAALFFGKEIVGIYVDTFFI
ncbi:MAG: prepilin peptidase [Oscillospiraceae bacterium]|nr:prepilin peptidase [Oscillospiraceae bacterium]